MMQFYVYSDNFERLENDANFTDIHTKEFLFCYHPLQVYFSLKPQQFFTILLRRNFSSMFLVHVTVTQMDKNTSSLTAGSDRIETVKRPTGNFSLLSQDYNLKTHLVSNCHAPSASPLKLHRMVSSYSNVTKTKNYIITYILKLYY